MGGSKSMTFKLILFIVLTALLPVLPGPAGAPDRAEAALPATPNAAAPGTPALGDGLFPDATGHWAAEPINFLGALDIVVGYPDGNCRPDQPLTTVEAVALLLRSTEYASASGAGGGSRKSPYPGRTSYPGRSPLPGRTPASGTGQKPADNIPPGAAWATSDLLLALDQQILQPEELREEVLLAPAPRYLVWQILARSLKIPLATTSGLNFPDANLIPAGALPAVATLVDLGLVRGFPDGTLRPLATITRAEMLSLLARMVDDGWLNPAPNRRLEGWVQEVQSDAPLGSQTRSPGSSRYPGSFPARRFPSYPGSPAAPRYTITLSTPATGSKGYPLAAGVAIFDTPLPGPQGLFNRHVVAVLNKRNEIAYIRASEPRTPVQTSINTGTIEKVIQGRDLQVIIRDLSHDLHTYATDWTTTAPGGILALKEGQWVKVALQGETIWSVEPLEVKKASGKVEEIDGRKLYLDNFAGDLGNVFLDWERARLANKDGTPYSGSGLKVGSSVEITCLDWDKLLEIRISE
ncbi:S-layer homology domain-containing protein [Moorella sp. Hama-1]|uniref:S-layer homology domain-containing protein n=1 Tax=Moorella sp. Hama-1 TaxID=2138101 RepID=UPI00137A2FDB|nr:S-layer homology domain-containing protein [Moorella sp. Hama-1]BCV22963.1 hypothetical protein hamaS1_30320 [Moorella sp. Hama-1]